MKDIGMDAHPTHAGLLRLTLPSITMLAFTSIYGVVDGFFVSNHVGKTAFSAVNFIMPFLMVLGSVGFMFGTGGGAYIAMKMGEGDRRKADETFSMLVYFSIGAGLVLSVCGLAVLRPLAIMLGARGALLEDCMRYARILLAGIPAYILQYEFQCLFATAGKPELGLYVTLAAGFANMLLDALFIAVFGWGLEGAAAATVISQCIGGFVPLAYFGCRNKSLLRLTRASFDKTALAQIAANGSSELMSSISMSLVNMLYNIQLLGYAGQDGVAAYGVLMYVNLFFQAVFIGYSVGSAPVVSYSHGAGDNAGLKNILSKSLHVILAFSVAMVASSYMLSNPLSRLFVGYDEALCRMTVHSFRVFSLSFLFSGFSIFGSSFFTALNDGPSSALISFLRTLVCQTAAVLLLPCIFGTEGVWVSIIVAEASALGITAFLLAGKRKRYGY